MILIITKKFSVASALSYILGPNLHKATHDNKSELSRCQSRIVNGEKIFVRQQLISFDIGNSAFLFNEKLV